jgi:hypothetical protein
MRGEVKQVEGLTVTRGAKIAEPYPNVQKVDGSVHCIR